MSVRYFIEVVTDDNPDYVLSHEESIIDGDFYKLKR